MEADITKQTRANRLDSAVLYPHARGALHVAKADGSEALVVDRVRITARKGGAKVDSLDAFDALPQHADKWPHGFGLLASPSSFGKLRKECQGDADWPAYKATGKLESASEPDDGEG